jgi:hypothetical protein
MAGMTNASVARGVRAQAKKAVALLETGFGSFGVRCEPGIVVEEQLDAGAKVLADPDRPPRSDLTGLEG